MHELVSILKSLPVELLTKRVKAIALVIVDENDIVSTQRFNLSKEQLYNDLMPIMLMYENTDIKEH